VQRQRQHRCWCGRRRCVLKPYSRMDGVSTTLHHHWVCFHIFLVVSSYINWFMQTLACCASGPGILSTARPPHDPQNRASRNEWCTVITRNGNYL
jgi:hypothetical protein